MDRRILTKFLGVLLVVVLSVPWKATTATKAQNSYPAAFSEQLIASALNSPTLMTAAPDGRLFVGLQGGVIRIIKNDQLLPAPFYTVPTASYDEQGLSGLTFDPNFASTGFVYVTYSVAEGNNRSHQRISRLTAAGDTGGNEVVLFELPRSRIEFHLAGALQFGADGRLYMTTGEGVGNDAQNTNDYASKILRLNPDGTIPTDNPFCQNSANKLCSIWAYGLRNPFVFSRKPGTDQFYVNDVGGSNFEEINNAVRGGNYGYPLSEGVAVNPGQMPPVHSYPHSNGDCAVVGGTFYTASQFPPAYQNRYFFSDYCSGWIKYFDPSAPGTPQTFGTATGIGLVSLVVGGNGDLYYLARGSTALDGGSGAGFDTGQVYKISYTASQAPFIISQPQSRTTGVGGTAEFAVAAGGPAPLRYRWQRNGGDIPGATTASYRVNNATLGDDGAVFKAIVSNATGSVTSTNAVLTVLDNQPPTATITLPLQGYQYSNGQVLKFAGTSSDPNSGPLPASNYTWKIDLHHDVHTHPFMPTTQGIASGEILVPEVPHATGNVFYRIYLIVTDGTFSTTVTRDVYPAPQQPAPTATSTQVAGPTPRPPTPAATPSQSANPTPQQPAPTATSTEVAGPTPRPPTPAATLTQVASPASSQPTLTATPTQDAGPTPQQLTPTATPNLRNKLYQPLVIKES